MQKIPESAKIVHTGPIFTVYQWEETMFDGSKATFEVLKRPDTVFAIAITKDKKILLTEEEQPFKGKFLSLPGGRCEKEEDPAIAIGRELLEETGYQGGAPEFFNKYRVTTKIDWEIHSFVIRNCEKVQEQKLDAGERISVSQVSFAEFAEMMMFDDRLDFPDLTIQFLRAKAQGKMHELERRILG